MMGDVPVNLEEYIPGSFHKYINNNGQINYQLSGRFTELLCKTECFAQYTYKSTKQNMMVLDLQGIDYNLCDPELATVDLLCDGVRGGSRAPHTPPVRHSKILRTMTSSLLSEY